MDDKKKALEQVLSQIEKQYGKGAIMRLGEDSREMTVEVIPTGCLALDIALGTGGVRRWASAAYPRAALLRFTDRNLPVKLP